MRVCRHQYISFFVFILIGSALTACLHILSFPSRTERKLCRCVSPLSGRANGRGQILRGQGSIPDPGGGPRSSLTRQTMYSVRTESRGEMVVSYSCGDENAIKGCPSIRNIAGKSSWHTKRQAISIRKVKRRCKNLPKTLFYDCRKIR